MNKEIVTTMEERILSDETKRETLAEIRKRAFPLRFCPVCKRYLPLGQFRTESNELRDSCADCYAANCAKKENKRKKPSRRWK
jgi:hypothetical protein